VEGSLHHEPRVVRATHDVFWHVQCPGDISKNDGHVFPESSDEWMLFVYVNDVLIASDDLEEVRY
jgi:hypothetical protein